MYQKPSRLKLAAAQAQIIASLASKQTTAGVSLGMTPSLTLLVVVVPLTQVSKVLSIKGCLAYVNMLVVI